MNEPSATETRTTVKRSWLEAVSSVLISVCLLASRISAVGDAVDYRYSPPEWQTAICLPDDPDKSLVDRSGELHYPCNQGGASKFFQK